MLYGYFNHRYNISPIHLLHFWVWEFYEGGPRVCPSPLKWSAIAGSALRYLYIAYSLMWQLVSILLRF
jgi:hypothetical protein